MGSGRGGGGACGVGAWRRGDGGRAGVPVAARWQHVHQRAVLAAEGSYTGPGRPQCRDHHGAPSAVRLPLCRSCIMHHPGGSSPPPHPTSLSLAPPRLPQTTGAQRAECLAPILPHTWPQGHTTRAATPHSLCFPPRLHEAAPGPHLTHDGGPARPVILAPASQPQAVVKTGSVHCLRSCLEALL